MCNPHTQITSVLPTLPQLLIQQHVKLRVTLLAALQVGMVVTSLVAIAGVIQRAINIATVALISAQPAQNVSHMRPTQSSVISNYIKQ